MFACLYVYVHMSTQYTCMYKNCGTGQGGPLTDKKIIDAFEKSDHATKKRAVKAAISHILTRAPMIHDSVKTATRDSIYSTSIMIGTEADWGAYNGISDKGELVGFDIALTKAVCKHAGKTCAIVTVPWQSVWPSSFPQLGWKDGNPKTYPGIGSDNAWFHCSVGTRNTLRRQQSTAFTDSYTDKTTDYAGFVAKDGSDLKADGTGLRVGILESQAYTDFFRQNSGDGKQFNVPTSSLLVKDTMQEVWALLEAGTIDAVYTGTAEAEDFLKINPTYTKYHFAFAGSEGVAYGCRPEFGDVVSALNDGLRTFKKSAEYQALCAKYPTIDCDLMEHKTPASDSTLGSHACMHACMHARTHARSHARAHRWADFSHSIQHRHHCCHRHHHHRHHRNRQALQRCRRWQALHAALLFHTLWFLLPQFWLEPYTTEGGFQHLQSACSNSERKVQPVDWLAKSLSLASQNQTCRCITAAKALCL